MTIPLLPDFSRPGQVEMSEAISYLYGIMGGEYAERFAYAAQDRLDILLRRVAEEIAESGRPFDRTDEEASFYFARPVYREKVYVSKSRARRSSAGLWYLFYTLEDRGGVGKADTLVIVAVRHSAAAPFDVSASRNDAA